MVSIDAKENSELKIAFTEMVWKNRSGTTQKRRSST
jgi:hypothetical protein